MTVVAYQVTTHARVPKVSRAPSGAAGRHLQGLQPPTPAPVAAAAPQEETASAPASQEPSAAAPVAAAQSEETPSPSPAAAPAPVRRHRHAERGKQPEREGSSAPAAAVLALTPVLPSFAICEGNLKPKPTARREGGRVAARSVRFYEEKPHAKGHLCDAASRSRRPPARGHRLRPEGFQTKPSEFKEIAARYRISDAPMSGERTAMPTESRTVSIVDSESATSHW